MKHSKIAIIGAGAVGVSTAYSLLISGMASELMLVDVNEQQTEGEVLDLNDALAFSKTASVKKVDFQTAATASIILITAGVAQKPGETRIDLLKRNDAVLKSIFEQLGELSLDTVVVLAINPVDVMTTRAHQYCHLPTQQVIGSGTLLDSQRLREEIASELKVAISSVHAYILGEHGDSQFPAWSLSSVGGVNVSSLIDQAKLDQMAEVAKKKAYEIINRKGMTNFGIGACLTRICEAIIFNKRWVLPLSIPDQTSCVCLSQTAILGETGFERFKLVLSADEQQQYEASISALSQAMEGL